MNPLLEPSRADGDEGFLVGRDPMTVSAEDFAEAGIDLSRTAMKAIRAKCLDCCCGQISEIRKCIATGCSLWPMRMGRYPAARRCPGAPIDVVPQIHQDVSAADEICQ